MHWARALSRRVDFVAEDGRVDADPLALAPRPWRFSLKALSLWLANPSVELDFQPECPWVGVRRLRSCVEWPPPSSDAREVLPRFRDSIAACLDDAPVVTVLFSGGLDSLAVLLHADAICRAEGRRLVAAVVELVDDQGVSCSQVARTLLGKLGIRCELAVFDADPADLREPDWSPAGPRADAMPRLNTAVLDHAAMVGSEVVLTGSGADEILQAPLFLTGALLRCRRWRDLRRYVADEVRYDGIRAFLGQALSTIGRWLPTRDSYALYQSFNTPDLANPAPAGVLAEQYLPHVRQWHRAWLAERMSLFERQGGDWLAAAAWESVFSGDMLMSVGAVPQRSPYLEPRFASWALGIPFAERYSNASPLPYHRYKPLVLSLFPAGAAAALPTYKQLYRAALPAHAARTLAHLRRQRPRLHCQELGLVAAADDEVLTADARILLRIVALEEWIDGALQRGAVADDEPAGAG